MSGLARLLSVLVVLCAGAPLQAQSIVADLSTREVAISTGFTGADLLLFGATEGSGDMIVTVVGPDGSYFTANSPVRRAIARALWGDALPPLVAGRARRPLEGSELAPPVFSRGVGRRDCVHRHALP